MASVRAGMTTRRNADNLRLTLDMSKVCIKVNAVNT